MEVVVHALRLHKAERQALRRREVDALGRPHRLGLVGQSCQRGIQVVYPQEDASERCGLTLVRHCEERQLPAPRIRADDREPVGSLYHVHAGVRRQEVGQPVAVGDPKSDVVE